MAFAVLMAAGANPLVAAPRFLGPNKCTSCHDHDKQAAWAAKDTHAKALSQLEDKNAAKYAKAIGLADPYDLKGSCVACHATVFNGDANAGVSCETCHGAGSDYLEPHQQKGSHAKSVTQGMIDTRGSYAVWAKMCVDCHILKDPKLIAAGHKAGADFEVGSSSQKIVHWAQTYDYAKLSAAGKAAGGRAAGAPAPPKPTPVPAPTSPPAPAAAPTPAPTKAAPLATRAPTSPAPAPTEVKPQAETRPAPTLVPAAPAATPIPEGKTKPTLPPAAAAAPATAVAAPASSSPTPEIAIVIEASPIPTRAPSRAPAPGEVAAPGPDAAPPVLAPSTPASAEIPKPSVSRPHVKKKPARRATHRPSAVPVRPTATPTKRPAPLLPPQRAPH